MQTCLQNPEDAGAGMWLFLFHVTEKMPCERHESFSNYLVSCGNERNTRFHWILFFFKSEKFFCANLEQVSLSRTKISVNIRSRFWTTFEARVGSAFMSNCIFQLHSALDSTCLEILVISNEKLAFLHKEDVDSAGETRVNFKQESGRREKELFRKMLALPP